MVLEMLLMILNLQALVGALNQAWKEIEQSRIYPLSQSEPYV